jgi:hypothetical protein
MKWLIATVACMILAAGSISCNRYEMNAGGQESFYPSVGETHEFGPGGSIADLDLSGYDSPTQAKIRAIR